MRSHSELRLYRAGWILFLVLAAAVALKNRIFPNVCLWKMVPPCFVYTATGFYCPGCGGSRSVAALLSGQILISAADYPAVPYCAAVYLWYMFSNTLELLSRHRWKIGMRYRPLWIYVALLIILAGWIVKNVIWLKTGIVPFLYPRSM